MGHGRVLTGAPEGERVYIIAQPNYPTTARLSSQMKRTLLTLSALFVASVTSFSVFAQDIKGNAAAGEKKTAMCVGCHGINGYHSSFPEMHRVPMIAGQSAKYIAASLTAYKKGERKHPTMRGIADGLSAQDIADLAAFYADHGVDFNRGPLPKPAGGPAQAMALVTRGGCVSCHGDNFSRPVDPSYPRIAGQHADYLYVALKSYKTTDKEQIGRSQPVMAGIAKQFSNEELKILAEYVGSLPSDLKTVQPNRFK